MEIDDNAYVAVQGDFEGGISTLKGNLSVLKTVCSGL